MRYVNCDGCGKWFHPECMKLTEEDAEKEEDWFCNECDEARKQ